MMTDNLKISIIVPVYNSVDEDDKVLVFKEVLSLDRLYLTKLYATNSQLVSQLFLASISSSK